MEMKPYLLVVMKNAIPHFFQIFDRTNGRIVIRTENWDGVLDGLPFDLSKIEVRDERVKAST